MHKSSKSKKAVQWEPEVTGYSSTDDVKFDEITCGKLPKFARKWFDLNHEQRDTLRQLRQKWIADQLRQSHQGEKVDADDAANAAVMDIDEMKKIMPKFAAKWFALSEAERQRYRAVKQEKRREKFGCGGVDIPPFAAKWFSLPQRKKNEYRKIKRHLKATEQHKGWASDGDQSDTAAGADLDYEGHGMPRFAAKWFALPKDAKDEIRIKYRSHKRFQKHGGGGGYPQHGGSGLARLFARMQLRSAPAKQQQQPMMPPYMPPQHAGYGMPPWMSAYWPQQQTYPMQHPYMPQPDMYSAMMGPPPFCVMKKFYRQQAAMMRTQGMTAASAEASSATSDTATSSDDDTAAADKDMPPFVKKWFKLPMHGRQQLRMLKQQQQQSGSYATDALPPFARKWFALSEKDKQAWRKVHRQQKRSHCNRKSNDAPTQKAADVTTKQSLAVDPSQVEVVKAKSRYETCDEIPEFALAWFALPVERKHHYRMLHRFMERTSSSSDTSDDQIDETMPSFAAQWLSLSSDEREHLRDLKHKQKPNAGCFGGKKRAPAHSRGGRHRHFGAHPWQHWPGYGLGFMPNRHFHGGRAASYQPMNEENPTDNRMC